MNWSIKGWMNEWMNEYKEGWKKDIRMKEWEKGWRNEWINKCINEWINQLKDKWMNTNKLKMKKWIKKDCIKEGMNKWTKRKDLIDIFK